MTDKELKDWCKNCDVEPPAMKFKCPDCKVDEYKKALEEIEEEITALHYITIPFHRGITHELADIVQEYKIKSSTSSIKRKEKGMTNKESVLIDFNDNPIYLKSIIKHLIELNKYPDISISYFTNPYIYGIQTKIRAELTLPTGSTITAERIGYSEDLKNEDLKNYLVESLLKEIAYRYIKRAFEKREIGDVKTKASSFGASCISILNENKFEEYQKLKQECVKLNNEIIDMNSIIEDAAINLGNKDFTLYDLPFEIKKLRQECEALKSESFTMDSLISMQEEEIDRYRKALEEIEDVCNVADRYELEELQETIFDIINRAKGAEDER